MKVEIVNYNHCWECRHGKVSYNHKTHGVDDLCLKSNMRRIPDINKIPSWCPLETDQDELKKRKVIK